MRRNSFRICASLAFWTLTLLFCASAFAANQHYYLDIKNVGEAFSHFSGTARTATGVDFTFTTSPSSLGPGATRTGVLDVVWNLGDATTSWTVLEAYATSNRTGPKLLIGTPVVTPSGFGGTRTRIDLNAAVLEPPPIPPVTLTFSATVKNFTQTARTVELKEADSDTNILLGMAGSALADNPTETNFNVLLTSTDLGFDVRGGTFTLWIDGENRGTITVPVELPSGSFTDTFGLLGIGNPEDLIDEPIPEPTPDAPDIPDIDPTPDPETPPAPTPAPLPAGTPSISSSSAYDPFGTGSYGGGNPDTSTMTKDDFYEAARRGVEDANGGASTFEVQSDVEDEEPDLLSTGQFSEKVEALVEAIHGLMTEVTQIGDMLYVRFPVYTGTGTVPTFPIPLPGGGTYEIDVSQIPFLNIIRLLAALVIITYGILAAFRLVRGAFVDAGG